MILFAFQIEDPIQIAKVKSAWGIPDLKLTVLKELCVARWHLSKTRKRQSLRRSRGAIFRSKQTGWEMIRFLSMINWPQPQLRKMIRFLGLTNWS